MKNEKFAYIHSLKSIHLLTKFSVLAAKARAAEAMSSGSFRIDARTTSAIPAFSSTIADRAGECNAAAVTGFECGLAAGACEDLEAAVIIII